MKTFFSVVDFLDAMYSKLLLPDISSPTRITSTSATLIDNIFTKDYDNTFTSGNLVTTFSDHVAQILVVPIRNITRHKEPKKVLCDFQEILRNKDIISRDLQNTNWDTEPQLNSENVNISTEIFMSKINNLINHWAPLKELSNAKQKLQNKPWITKEILKSVKNKNKQYKTMCRTKNLTKCKIIEQEFPNLHFSNYLSEPVEETLTFRVTNELEVTSIINSLNTRKAFGPASIPTNFLKLFKDELSKPISLLTKTLTLKKKQLYGPFLWMGFNCLKARATSRRQFTFYHEVPRNFWYSYCQPWEDERLTQPWSHPVVLNTEPLYLYSYSKQQM